MASKSLRLHPGAEDEYLAALGWYQDRSPIAAQEFQTAVRQAGESIRKAPQRWPFYFGRFQKYTLRQFPFSIVYQEMLSEVVIFAIAHASRKPGYWRNRE